MTKMKLYRIRRKDTGAYFVSSSNFPGSLKSNRWGPTGVFFKTKKAINNHLTNLCTDLRWSQERPINWRTAIVNHGLIKGRIDLFEIVITDVTINNESTVDAKTMLKEKS